MIERLKALWAKFVARFQKKAASSHTAAQPPLPPVDVFPPKPNPFLAYKAQGFTMVDIYRVRQQQGMSASLSEAELKQAREAGYVVDGVTVQSVVYMGTDMSDGNVHGPWVLPDHQQMTLTGSGRVRIWGAAGTELQEVNGFPLSGTTAWHDADLPFTFSVKSIGGNIVAKRI